MAKVDSELIVTVKVVIPKIKLWEAIKLRIAGPEVRKLIDQITSRIGGNTCAEQ